MVFSQRSKCRCYNGINSSNEDKPLMEYEFSDSIKIIVCGFLEQKINSKKIIVSEFDVFDKITGNSIVSYGAVPTCELRQVGNQIQISELFYLPIGKKWKYKRIPLFTQFLKIDDEKLVVSEKTFLPTAIKVDSSMMNVFMGEVYRNKGILSFNEVEVFMDKLLVLSLNNYPEAFLILNDFKTYFNVILDGTYLEHLNRNLELLAFIKIIK